MYGRHRLQIAAIPIVVPQLEMCLCEWIRGHRSTTNGNSLTRHLQTLKEKFTNRSTLLSVQHFVANCRFRRPELLSMTQSLLDRGLAHRCPLFDRMNRKA